MPNDYLYPEREPYDHGMLEVEAPHRLYFEQCGNPEGLPIVFLHGGPGSGCSPAHRRFFDSERYRVVLFDQRGAGRSEPAACLDNNTTQALVADLETLRARLNVDRWLIYGGSWGAALALLYAQVHPQCVLGLVLRGVFLARRSDAVWVYGRDGVAQLFPREYEAFLNHLAADERQDPMLAYYQLFRHGEAGKREAAARQWDAWESRVVRQFLPPAPESKPPDVAELLRRALIVSHYAHHDFFLDDGVRLRFEELRDKPCIIIHGQRDLVCPLAAAWTLYRACPQAELRIVEEGGHIAAEPAVGRALLIAFNEMATRLMESVPGTRP